VRAIRVEPADEASTWGRTFRLRFPKEGESANPFDRGAAAAALSAVWIRTCRVDGVRGDGHLRVRFAPDGVIVDAAVDSPPYAGTDLAACVEERFMSARIPSYSGAPIPVGKSFSL
jgi:hypothetical protein